ncbi:MAG: hypothetical protein ACF8NJ_04400 [Phycisphaerales bacterium JB038]
MSKVISIRSLLVLLLAGLLSAAVAPPGAAVADVKAQAEDESKQKTVDIIYFRNQSKITGNIISETETEVVIEVIIGNIPPQEFTYSKEQILLIEYDQPVEGEAEEEAARRDEDEAQEGVPVVVLNLDGRFGFHISPTPLREALEAVDRSDAEYVIVKLDCQEGNVWSLQAVFDVFDDFVNKKWKEEGPDLVFWVKMAVEGAGLIPFVDEDIYFTRDGIMGGITNFDDSIRGAPATQMIIEKWVSATMGHVEGIAINGGYDTRLVRAMIFEEYELSVDLEGGQPVYHEDLTGDIVLTDSGQGEFADTISTGGTTAGSMVRNDVLNLDDEMAYRLRVSDGTADTIEQLMYLLGLRKYHLLDGSPQKRLAKWSEGIDRDVPRIRDRMAGAERRMGQIRGDYQEATRTRGAIIRELKEILALVKRYEEVLDPGQNFRIRIELWIDQIKRQQQIANENRRP